MDATFKFEVLFRDVAIPLECSAKLKKSLGEASILK